MLYEKIVKLANEKDVSIRKIELECGLSNGSIVKWKDVKPLAESLYKVAKYLDVPIEYFLTED